MVDWRRIPRRGASRHLGVRPKRGWKLPCCVSISSSSTTESCHLYTNLEVAKEKTWKRGRSDSENWKEEADDCGARRRAEQGESKHREREREERERVHMLLHDDGVMVYGGGTYFRTKGLFLKAAYTRPGKHLSLLRSEARRVATILLCVSFGRPL